MPSTAICWPSYDACSAAIELPKTSETRSSTLCCFARLLISPLEYSLLHSLDSKRHESRRLVGTRVVVPPYQPVAQWSEPCSGAHTLRCFPPQPAIATDSFFWALSLSRLCMRCSLELLALRPRPKPKREDYQPLAPPVTAVPPATSTRKSALYRENQEPWYSASSCRALPTSHIRSANSNRSVI